MTTITIHSIPLESISEIQELILDPKVGGELEYKVSDILHRTDHATIAIRSCISTTRFEVSSIHAGIFIEIQLSNDFITGINIDPGESTGVTLYND